MTSSLVTLQLLDQSPVRTIGIHVLLFGIGYF